MKTITHEEWVADGERLYGKDRKRWRFKCPACKREISMEDAKATFPEVRGKGWSPATECVGRYTDRVDCDWAAYGLFRGPVIVTGVEGTKDEVPCFEFGRPMAPEKKEEKKHETRRLRRK